MEETLPLEQLTVRLFAVERETARLRRDLEHLSPTQTGPEKMDNCFLSVIEQKQLTQAMERLFSDLSIQASPIGAQKLQELMRQQNLEPNEFSHGIIEMRDE